MPAILGEMYSIYKICHPWTGSTNYLLRPPSRYQTGVLRCANGDFSCDSCGKIQIFRCVRMVLEDFVIMVLSLTYLL